MKIRNDGKMIAQISIYFSELHYLKSIVEKNIVDAQCRSNGIKSR